MAFEVRATDLPDYMAVVFTDDEWRNLLALAHACGFDPEREHEEAAYLKGGEAHELGAEAGVQLHKAVGVVLDQNMLPFATTWEEEDADLLPFRWVGTPWYYAGDRDLEFRLSRSKLERLLGLLDRGPVVMAYFEDTQD